MTPSLEVLEALGAEVTAIEHEVTDIKGILEGHTAALKQIQESLGQVFDLLSEQQRQRVVKIRGV